jgi:hypothetical protein
MALAGVTLHTSAASFRIRWVSVNMRFFQVQPTRLNRGRLMRLRVLREVRAYSLSCQVSQRQ